MQFDALVFDFDGVLVESADVKTRAFEQLYSAHGPDVRAKAVAYHLAHAGISRFVKFRHLHQTLLGVSLSDRETTELGERFSVLVIEAVIAASWVAGAAEFLEAHHRSLPLFVASGTPEGELRVIIARRGMQSFFRSIHGSPTTKGEIINGIVLRHRLDPSRVLMVGDSTTDYQEAAKAGVRFLGVARPGSRIFPKSVAVLPNLTGLTQFVNDTVPQPGGISPG